MGSVIETIGTDVAPASLAPHGHFLSRCRAPVNDRSAVNTIPDERIVRRLHARSAARHLSEDRLLHTHGCELRFCGVIPATREFSGPKTWASLHCRQVLAVFPDAGVSV